jgi:hypothetical protein
MTDVYAAITEVDVATQERLAAILELRAADPQQRVMLDSYLLRSGSPGRAGARDWLRNGAGCSAAGTLA